MKNEVELTKKHFAFNEYYDKNTGNSNIPASRRMLWNKLEQLKEELEVYKKALELLSVTKSEFAREYYIGKDLITKEDYDTYMKNDPIRTIKMYLNQARKELESEKD